MSTQKYVSDVKFIGHNQQVVFDYLSDFENFSQYLNSGLFDKIAEQVPGIKINDFQSDCDSCQFSITGMGTAHIRIVEREPHKTIKVEGSGGLPIGITFWIQLLPVSEAETKMRLTLHTELNMMMKMLVGNKLEEGINQLAETIKNLPYG